MKIYSITVFCLTLIFSLIIAPFYGLYSMLAMPVLAINTCLRNLKIRKVIKETFDSMSEEFRELEGTNDIFVRNALSKELQLKLTQKVLKNLNIDFEIQKES